MSERSPNPSLDTPVSGPADTWPLTARDAAALLGVSERTIRRAIARGALHAVKRSGAFRIAPEELDRYRTRARRGHLSFGDGAESCPQLVLLSGTQAPPNAPLPRPLTSFLGREAEVESIRAFVDRPDVQLVTPDRPRWRRENAAGDCHGERRSHLPGRSAVCQPGPNPRPGPRRRSDRVRPRRAWTSRTPVAGAAGSGADRVANAPDPGQR